MQITTIEVVIAGNVLAWALGAFHHYALGQKIKAFLVKDAPVIADVGTKVLRGVEDVIKSPVLAPVELKLHNTIAELADTRLAHIASAGLLAARVAFDKTYDALTANEKAAVVNVVKAELRRLGANVAESDIAAALDEARKLADQLGGSDVFKTTAALEQSLKVLFTPEQPTPAPAAQ